MGLQKFARIVSGHIYTAVAGAFHSTLSICPELRLNEENLPVACTLSGEEHSS